MRRIGRTATRLTPLWKFDIEGERPADIDHRAYVVVANHESQADPFLLSWLPFDMRWVAKEELFRQPLTGWAMRFGGDIPLRRGEGESVREMMEECERALAGGISVMMFPEGTRSKDGDLLPFRDGAFRLAIARRRADPPRRARGHAPDAPEALEVVRQGPRVREDPRSPSHRGPRPRRRGVSSREVARRDHRRPARPSFALRRIFDMIAMRR